MQKYQAFTLIHKKPIGSTLGGMLLEKEVREQQEHEQNATTEKPNGK